MSIRPLPEEEWNNMYLSLGRAISRWANIEDDLARLYVESVNPDMASISEECRVSVLLGHQGSIGEGGRC